MLNICSLIQKFFGFIKTIPKKAYRTSVILMSGTALVAIISFNSNSFSGSGKNDGSGKSSKTDTEFQTDDDTDELAEVQTSFSILQQAEDEDYYQLDSNKLNYAVSILNSETEVLENNLVKPSVVANQNNTLSLTQETLKTNEEQESIQHETVETIQETVSDENTSNQMAQSIEVSDNDYYWLIRIVEAEAGDQDEAGRIMVTNVIMNRVNSGTFPTTIKGVIFQNDGTTYQFEPVKNERIYDVEPSQTTIECVDRALAGEDYSQGALFFTMRTSQRSWFNTSLTLLFVHGDHYFYTY